ncbi:MAG: hypothetical protein CTY28_09580 [Hyphomicrobium sp.]|nr:MAG: hypothetical protein CTY28_09580 [Hyphomicrobium sp.]
MSEAALRRALPDLLIAVAKPFRRITALTEASRDSPLSMSERGRVENLKAATFALEYYQHHLELHGLSVAALPIRECEVAWSELQALNYSAVQSRGWKEIFGGSHRRRRPQESGSVGGVAAS